MSVRLSVCVPLCLLCVCVCLCTYIMCVCVSTLSVLVDSGQKSRGSCKNNSTRPTGATSQQTTTLQQTTLDNRLHHAKQQTTLDNRLHHTTLQTTLHNRLHFTTDYNSAADAWWWQQYSLFSNLWPFHQLPIFRPIINDDITYPDCQISPTVNIQNH